jgi:thioredoxin reductase
VVKKILDWLFAKCSGSGCRVFDSTRCILWLSASPHRFNRHSKSHQNLESLHYVILMPKAFNSIYRFRRASTSGKTTMRIIKRISVCKSGPKLPLSSYHAKYFASHKAGRHFDAVVIGAGPGGLTCASNLLDQGLSKICIFDPAFNAGRINEKYREVPSNTKAGLFAQWATGTKAFSEIIERAPKGNAFEKLKSFDQDKTCQLADAVDVAKLLSDGLREDPRVTSVISTVNHLAKEKDVWSLPQGDISADRVVLATGSHPRPNHMFDSYSHVAPLDLDTALAPSVLRKSVPTGSKVGVVGSSHSAILALKNLFDLGDVSIVNFYRSPLLYAIYKDGWILYDNTGLKGMAADWAREMLEGENLPPNIRRVNLKEDARSEKQIYDAELKDCTHIVSAIGYDVNALPRIEIDGGDAQPVYDPLSGKFYVGKGKHEYLKGLYGAGIAFPERVTDPEGNVESAVGWFKFMKFVKKVSPQWLEEGA